MAESVCRRCGKPIHQVGYASGMKWEHKPEPGGDAAERAKTFNDQGMSHKAAK